MDADLAFILQSVGNLPVRVDALYLDRISPRTWAIRIISPDFAGKDEASRQALVYGPIFGGGDWMYKIVESVFTDTEEEYRAFSEALHT